MGALKNAEDRIIQLPSRLLVGRARGATLRLADQSVSGEHAVLVALESSWVLRDLGSANGTFIDGRRVEPGLGNRLHLGSELRFGLSPEVYRLVDAAPPQPFAQRLADGAEVSASSGVLALPSPDAPVLQLMQLAVGWVCSGENGDHSIADGEVVEIAAQAWRVFLPGNEEETRRPRAAAHVRQLALTFRVSADEETVMIELRLPHAQVLLESRAHNYLLLDLARRRLADRHLPAAEQGWIERTTLAERLHVDPEHLNVQLFRIRKMFSEVAVADAGNLLECRRRPGQIRIGITDLKVLSPPSVSARALTQAAPH